jgi:hypothetical protein
MLKKLSILLSLAAALALGVVFAAPGPALAQTHHHHSTAHHGSGHGGYTVGHSYGGHVYYGHNRHRWHGRWYGYGVGPCWINVGGVWLWNVAACP